MMCFLSQLVSLSSLGYELLCYHPSLSDRHQAGQQDKLAQEAHRLSAPTVSGTSAEERLAGGNAEYGKDCMLLCLPGRQR